MIVYFYSSQRNERNQFIKEVPDALYEIRIHRGSDAEFIIYENAGDTDDYEKGAFVRISLSWVESLDQLTIDDRQGSFPELIEKRQYKLIFISSQGQETTSVLYTGNKIQVVAENSSKI